MERSSTQIKRASKAGEQRAQTPPDPARSLALLQFLQKYSLALALCLIAIACARIAATYTVLSLTADEPGHFACGLEYLSKHVYRYESQHPPLARAMSALGPYLDGVRLVGGPERNKEGLDVILRSGRPDRNMALMRLGVLPFFILASLVVYFWSRHHFGKDVAVIATGLFTLIPPVLAHAGLATTDMGLTACLGAAFFSLVLWAESPTYPRTFLLGLTAALAALSKFTALGYLPAAAVFALLFYFAARKQDRGRVAVLVKERAGRFGLSVLIGAVFIWAAYWFSYGAVPGWSIRLPAPEFFDGISVAMHHNAEGHLNYLLGEVSTRGWWYYFPVVLAVKTPIGFLLLLVLGIVYAVKRRTNARILLPLAFCLGILIPAMTSNVNIGVRHILPVYIGFSILAGFAVVRLAESKKSATGALLASLLIFATAVSGALQHPDYLSYFNFFAGSEPANVLVDSDLDWGQEAKLLARRLRELGVKEVSLRMVGSNGIAHFEAWYGLPHILPFNGIYPNPGWNVVSMALSKVIRGSVDLALLRQGVTQAWPERIAPTEKLGPLLLYNIPRDFQQAP